MSDTVKYSDEKKLLTSDEFIAAAKANADKNLQIQKDMAQKVYDSTYASLDRQYSEAAAAAGVAKERNLIDADTAYQRQEMKYGAEQEALAAAGLSGSGMNEYRRAQSYQKNREDRQMSYAEYDRALREANYAREQGKLATDLNKVQSDAAAEMHYNDTMTGISEKELGYAELERQEIGTAYGGYLAGIENGSLTMDQIKADSSWAKLSPEQQASVEKTAKIKGIKTKIDNGDKWENVQNSYAYLELDKDGKNQIDAYHAEVEAGKTKDANAASGNYLDMAMKGMSIDSIVALAKANGHYQTLVDSGFWAAVTKEAENYANEQNAAKVESDYNTALALLADGWTLDEIKNHLGADAVKALTDSGKLAQLENASNVMARIKSETEGKTAQESLLTYLDLAASGKYTLDQLVAVAKSLGHYDTLSKLDENDNETGLWAQVVSKFEETEEDEKTSETLTNIENAIADGATLDEIKEMPGYNELDETTKTKIAGAIEDRDNEKQTLKEQISAGLRLAGYTSVNDVKDYLASEGVPASDRAEYIAQWQEDMTERTLEEIEDGSFVENTDEAALAKNIKNGAYGNNGAIITAKYVDKMLSLIDNESTLYDILAIKEGLETLKEFASNDVLSKISALVRVSNENIDSIRVNGKKADKTALISKVNGNKTITDKNTIESLEKYRDKNKQNQIVFVGGKICYSTPTAWYDISDIFTLPDTPNNTVEDNKNTQTPNVLDVVNKDTGAYTETDENGNKVLVIGKKK